MPHPLLPFLDAARAKGAQDAFLVQLLREAGWPESQIYRAFLERYAAETGVAIPPPVGSRAESAKDAFLYILSFIALGGWAIALGSMLFTFINIWIPEPQDYGSNAMTFQMATVLIALPLYVLITRALERGIAEHPEKQVSPVRNWLSSLVLLATAGTLMGDLIGFLYMFLDGELTIRFVLKVLVVLAIAGGIFFFYYRAFRKRRAQDGFDAPSRTPRILGLTAIFVSAVVLAAGFFYAGSPLLRRAERMDALRLERLQSIARAINEPFLLRTNDSTAEQATLPESLDVLMKRQGVWIDEEGFFDPVSHALFEYRIIDATHYELCAMFDRATPAGPVDTTTYYGFDSEFWRHSSGRSCYSIDAEVTI